MQRLRKRDRRLGYQVEEEIAKKMIHKEVSIRRLMMLWNDWGGGGVRSAVVAPGTGVAEAAISASTS